MIPAPQSEVPQAHSLLSALRQTRQVQFSAQGRSWDRSIDDNSALHQAERAMAVALLSVGKVRLSDRVLGLHASLRVTPQLAVPCPKIFDGVMLNILPLQVTNRGHLIAKRASLRAAGSSEGWFSGEEGITLMNRAHWTAPKDTGLVLPLGAPGILAVVILGATISDSFSLARLLYTLIHAPGAWLAVTAICIVGLVRYVRFTQPPAYFEFPESGRFSDELHISTMQRLGAFLPTWPLTLTAEDSSRLAVANGRDAETPSRYRPSLHGLNVIRAAVEKLICSDEDIHAAGLAEWRQAERAMAYALVSATNPRPADYGGAPRQDIVLTWPPPNVGPLGAEPVPAVLGRDGVLRVQLIQARASGVPLASLNPSLVKARKPIGVAGLIWPVHAPSAIALGLFSAGVCAFLRGNNGIAITYVTAGIVIAAVVATARVRQPAPESMSIEAELDSAQHVALLEQLLARARSDDANSMG